MIRQQFRETYENCIRRPREYKMSNLKNQNPVAYSVDKIFQRDHIRGKRCDDFVLFDLSEDEAGIYLIEIKSNRYEVDEVTAQLKGGANCISDRLPLNQSFDFLPVLVARKISRSSAKILRQKTVSIGEKAKRIELVEKHDELPVV